MLPQPVHDTGEGLGKGLGTPDQEHREVAARALDVEGTGAIEVHADDQVHHTPVADAAGTTRGDQLAEVGEHLAHRGHSVLRHAVHALLAGEEAPDQGVQHVAVLHREAVGETGHLDRDLVGEVVEEVGLRPILHLVEGAVHDLLDRRLLLAHPPRSEVGGHLCPHPGVTGRVDVVQHRRDGLHAGNELSDRGAFLGGVPLTIHGGLPDILEAREEVAVPLFEMEAGVLLPEPGVDRVGIVDHLLRKGVVVDHRRLSLRSRD